MNDTYLSIAEAADKLQVSERTIRNWIEAGKLPAYRFGLAYRIKTEDFESFIESSKVNKTDN